MVTPHLDARRWNATLGDLSDVIAADDINVDDVIRWRLNRLEPRWLREAACRRSEHQHVDFFGGKRAQAEAIKVCAACPVLIPCRQFAIAAEPPLENCVVGGYTPAALKLARPRRRPGRKDHHAPS